MLESKKPVSRKLGISLALLVGILTVFAFGAYSDHAFLGEHYRDNPEGILFGTTEQEFVPAGPYRSDFDDLLAKSDADFTPAGPYREDFNELLARSEGAEFVSAGPYRDDFDELLRESETEFDPAGPYMADFH